MALDHIRNKSLDNKFVISSDSLSVLKSLSHTSSKNPKVQSLIKKKNITSYPKLRKFCSVGSPAILA